MPPLALISPATKGTLSRLRSQHTLILHAPAARYCRSTAGLQSFNRSCGILLAVCRTVTAVCCFCVSQLPRSGCVLPLTV